MVEAKADKRGQRRARGSLSPNRVGNYQVRYTDPSGRRRTAETFRLKRDAEQALARVLAAIENNTWGVLDDTKSDGLDPKTVTLRQASILFREGRLNPRSGQPLSPYTVSEYARLVDRTLAPFADQPLRSTTTPRLLLDSPVPESGKTTLLDHLERLCREPLKIGSAASPALLARCLEDGPRTLLLDEEDRTLNPKEPGTNDRLAILNTGYKRGGNRPVLVAEGSKWVVTVMPTFAPVAIVGNTPQLPDDTRSRCIEVRLLPALGEEIEDSDWEEIEPDAELLREAILQAVEALGDQVSSHRPTLPAGCKHRNREKWLPLKRVAAQAGPDWEHRADALIEADLYHQKETKEAGMHNKRPPVLLAEHLSDYYLGGPAFSPTEEVLAWLIDAHPEAWSSESGFGKNLTPQRLGQMLSRSYGITSQRPDQKRGYNQNQFSQVWQSLGIRQPAEPVGPVGCLVHNGPTREGHCAQCELEARPLPG
jgi:hypothetical protein